MFSQKCLPPKFAYKTKRYAEGRVLKQGRAQPVR